MDSANTLLDRVDHLVFACPDLAVGVPHVERLLGVTAVPGGQHLGLGTRNYLIGLGATTYLEVVGPDPDQPDPSEPRWFRIDELTEPRLVTWSARGRRLVDIVDAAEAAGFDLGQVTSGGRICPDGSQLSWSVTDPRSARADGVVPFFIDWAEGPHPSDTLEGDCSLKTLTLKHPEAPVIQRWLTATGLEAVVEVDPRPRLIATLATPAGIVELT